MKKMSAFSMIIMVLILASACTVKKTSSTATSGSSNLSNQPTPDTQVNNGPTSNGSLTSCDGIVRDGVTKCYYRLPTITASGGNYGQVWWKSTDYVTSSGNSPNMFSTDATFNVRVVQRVPSATATSTFGNTCSQWMTYATKLRVQLMLHRPGVSVGEIATLTSSIDTPSKVWHFAVPASADPLVLEVINVESDSSCSGKYGTPSANCSTNVYNKIPVNTRGPTECVAFDVHFSVDDTYDVPGPSAN